MLVSYLQSKDAILSLPSPIATETAEVAAHPWTARQGTRAVGSSFGDVSAVAGNLMADENRPGYGTGPSTGKRKAASVKFLQGVEKNHGANYFSPAKDVP
jgi:hypothetical protein